MEIKKRCPEFLRDILAIRIRIAAVQFPLHHYTEEKVVHYLATRKKLKVQVKNVTGRFLMAGKQPIRLWNLNFTKIIEIDSN